MNEIAAIMGGDTKIALIREATKIHEEVLRGAVADILKQTAGRVWKGECVLVVNRKEQVSQES